MNQMKMIRLRPGVLIVYLSPGFRRHFLHWSCKRQCRCPLWRWGVRADLEPRSLMQEVAAEDGQGFQAFPAAVSENGR